MTYNQLPEVIAEDPSIPEKMRLEYLAGGHISLIAKKYGVEENWVEYNYGAKWSAERLNALHSDAHENKKKRLQFANKALDTMSTFLDHFNKDLENKPMSEIEAISRMVVAIDGPGSPVPQIVNQISLNNQQNQGLSLSEMREELRNDPLTNPNAIRPGGPGRKS